MPVRSDAAAASCSASRCASSTDQVWHCYLPEARPGQLYGYRVHGPVRAASRATASTRTSCCSIPTRATSSARCAGATRISATASAARARRPVVRPPRQRGRHAEVPGASTPPSPGATTAGRDVPWHDTVIYELHVRGFTMRHPRVPPAAARHLRGPRARAPVIEHLQAPRRHRGRADAGARLRRRPPPGRARACATTGATTRIGFFAPEPRYCAARQRSSEFKTMVKALHAAGIEVILDVVYNHTGEGNQLGPDAVASAASTTPPTTASCPTTRATTTDFTGCGNTLNLRAPARAAADHGLAALLGRRRCTSTASASTSPRRSRASCTSVDRLGALLRRRSARTRCCRRSS